VADIQRIVVGVDFSEYSQRALDDAIALAKKFGAELHLLHCFQVYPVEAGGFPYPTVPEIHERAIREAAAARLIDWRDKVTAQGVRAEQHLAIDRPSHGIVALAEKLAADLIVVGTYGLTGLKHVLLGSVAERVIRNAPCPVLTVK
jgi:nucleotide-binding universal stress UspA family protein